jgi:hypothetical protein
MTLWNLEKLRKDIVSTHSKGGHYGEKVPIIVARVCKNPRAVQLD